MNYSPPGPDPQNQSTVNVAGADANVGVQASTVHNAYVYQVPPDASPQQRFEAGERLLHGGMPSHAQKRIGEAIAGGLDTPQVRFHLVLAILSKRSYRDLNRDERETLHETAASRDGDPADEYAAALEAVRELLGQLKRRDGDHTLVEKRILALPAELRAKIDRHLSLVLAGTTRDKLWQQTREAAARNRYANERAQRMWAFFHPKPIGPRLLDVPDPRASEPERFRATLVTLLFAIGAGYLGWLTLASLDPAGILAYLMAALTGVIGLRDAFDWRYRNARIAAEHISPLRHDPDSQPQGSGFTKRVAHSFDHYFGRYRPDGLGWTEWLDITEPVRRCLRQEVAHIYRERRVPVERVNWLIGFLARDVRRRWRAGTRYERHRRYRVRPLVKLRCVLSLAILFIAATQVLTTAIPEAPFYAVLASVVVIGSGPYAALRWEYILGAERRYADDREEAALQLTKREAEYERWKTKLDTLRPKDTDMETWLNCDKTALIDEALRHYRLSWSDVISHAILQGPARGRNRARVKDGPWRFSRYDLRLFLITKDGVREVISELDFLGIGFKDQERNNFRFDALSSVNVAQSSNSSRTLNLTLTNGPTRNIRITDAEEPDPEEVDDTADLLKLNLDASGFMHALRLLEGIAAEGKGWISRDGFGNPAPD